MLLEQPPTQLQRRIQIGTLEEKPNIIQSGSSSEAQLVVVREALKLAWDKGLRRVILESDSESVVNRIRNQLVRQPKNQLEEIILECQGYGSQAWNCFFQHTRREGNFAADAILQNQIGHLKVLKRELLARNLHWN
ncbi:hypothetical protein OIU74_015672 [Salix koriyanagi]|uniref:RNase H type-1 domain-containing protein n=1 Tax=Salix koriyanagi TaxID=2511006 RepID=A0A9Q0PNE3_9ROSI|nr:hypothetical protein OIU74_015672 [Salix koriyanagi]